MLKITDENVNIGNRAMASVLLLYYHLMLEGGITNDQTVYVAADFNAAEFVGVEVQDGLDVDQQLIREGACVSLLCDLNDQIGEYYRDYLMQPRVQEILKSLSSRGAGIMPELDALLALVSQGEENLYPKAYAAGLKRIFEKYVAGKWHGIGMALESHLASAATNAGHKSAGAVGADDCSVNLR